MGFFENYFIVAIFLSRGVDVRTLGRPGQEGPYIINPHVNDLLLIELSSSFGLFQRFMIYGSRSRSRSLDGAVELPSKTLRRSCWIFMGQFNDMKFKVVSSSPVDKTESESESGSHKNVRVRGKPPGSSDGKTRVRTVLNEKQLHTLR